MSQKRPQDRGPEARHKTLRGQILEALEGGRSMTLLEISQEVGASTKALPAHLEHLSKSLKARGATLLVEAPTCCQCGFEFESRGRFTRPGKCPKCRSTRITPPAFRLES